MNEAEKLAERLLDIDTKYRFVSHEHGVIDGAAALLRSQAEQIKVLREALGRCADWMERLRASGDAGHWDWNEGDDYTQGRSALAATKEET